MYKTDHQVTSFKSAHSGRVKRVIFAPPFLVFGIFGAGILLQIPAGYVIHNFSFTLGMFLNQIVTLLLPVIIIVRVFDLTPAEIFRFRRVGPKIVAVAVLMMIVLAILSDYLIFFTEKLVDPAETLDQSYRRIMGVSGFFSFLHKFIFLCILPSFCEEIFFRGFCQTGLEKNYGRKTAIVVVAAMFAVAHLSPVYAHIYFLLGLFLGWIFVSSGSLWIPVACHIANNFWTFATYTIGLKIPSGGNFGTGDYFIITVSIISFAGLVMLWRYLVSQRL